MYTVIKYDLYEDEETIAQLFHYAKTNKTIIHLEWVNDTAALLKSAISKTGLFQLKFKQK